MAREPDSHLSSLLLLLFIFPTIQAQDDDAYICPKNLKQCSCPSELSRDFIFTCHSHSSELDVDYTIQFEPKLHQVRVECLDMKTNLSNNFLDVLELPPTISTVGIYTCPAPEGKFKDLLGRFTNVTTLNLILANITANQSLFEELDGVENLSLEVDESATIDAGLLQDMASLKTLKFSKSQLQELPRGLFANTTRLVDINLDGNTFSSLSEGIFTGLTELEQLSINYNELSTISEDAFDDLPRLRNLSLNKNMLQTIPPKLFADLPSLEQLDLRYNVISELPLQLFQNNRNLKKLFLEHNQINYTLPGNIFHNTTKMTELRLDDNELIFLPFDLLESLTSLQSISLSHNQLKAIPLHFFKNNANLTEIDLRVNKLSSLPLKLFSSLNQLQCIYLQNNFFTSIGRNIFGFLPSLKKIDFSQNEIEMINVHAFEGSDNITFLDLSDNGLKLQQQVFDLPNNLQYLNLSRNLVIQIPLDWISAKNLEILNLSNNNIAAINMQELQFSSKNLVIDLQMNKIDIVNIVGAIGTNLSTSTLPPSQYSAFQQPKILIDNNPMRCDCNLLPFIQYLKYENLKKDAPVYFEANSLFCSSPAEDFNYRAKLTSIIEESVSCKIKDACDSRCSCKLSAVSGRVTVNCSNQNLIEVPRITPINMTEIHVENNNLSTLTVLESPKWKHVTQAFFSHNRLQNIDRAVMLPPKLHLLTLDGNYLEVMPSWLIDYANNQKEFILRLGNNPWKCDCNTANLVGLLNSSKHIVNDISKVRCGPGPLENERIVDLETSRLCPHHRAATSAPVLVMLFTTIILLLIVGITAFIVLRNRDRIKLWFFRRRMCLCLRTEDDIEAGHPL